ncbi:hypothetical protein [Oceanobacillus sojae]|uniref:hypothetical protein n=1 Tax=Oceanobacillus sojae TaxID=582851 RepID=UPI0009888E52|nr:hypothetical protein [Oceanobacillus sojae]MCT1905378.1 MSCRAMM family adhesin SdrC [Oceanobacillus sojae]
MKDISNFQEKVYDKEEETRMGENKVKSRFLMVIAIAMALLLGACNKDKEEEQEPAPEPEEQTEEIPELEEAEAEEVLQTYEETYQNIVENAEEDGELADFDSLEDVQQEFLSIMSEELADDVIDTYFEENEEGLIYIDTSEAPVWFDEEEAYEFEKVEDNLYEVEQEQEENQVVVTYSIFWDEEKWIVSAVETEEIPSEESDASNDESGSDTDVNQSEQEDNEATNGDTDEATDEDESIDSAGNTVEEEKDNQVGSDSEETNSSQGDSDSKGTSNDTDASEDDQNSDSAEDDGENTEEASGSISESEAENIVKAYLSIDDNDLNVVTDHQDENGNYVVQVYSVVGEGDSSHTSTFGWFIVNKETGAVEQMQ